MKNCGKVRERYNEGVDWMLPYFKAIKCIGVALTINKKAYIGKVVRFKSSDIVGI